MLDHMTREHRWTQMSEDLVPVVVSSAASNGRHANAFHVTAYSSLYASKSQNAVTCEKVLDTWLCGTRLGQASACFVYWKDSVTGDTWGLNFTSAADARAFRELVSCSRDFRRAESSFSLTTGQTATQPNAQSATVKRPLSHRQSAPNSPTKRRANNANDCTCECLLRDLANTTSTDALHKTKRNGRRKYTPTYGSAGTPSAAAFAVQRQDSGATTHSNASAGRESLSQRSDTDTRSANASLARRREAFYGSRGGVRSMEGSATARTQQRVNTSTTMPRKAEQTQQRSRSTENLGARSVGTSTDEQQRNASTYADLKPETLKRMICPLASDTCRPKSMSEVTDACDRSRQQRSDVGRRRSLERTQCFELADSESVTPVGATHHTQTHATDTQSRNDTSGQTNSDSLERELRAFLLSESINKSDISLQQYVQQSMEDVARSSYEVALLMREVQNELRQIRREEEMVSSSATLPASASTASRLRGASSLVALHRSSAPILDTLSIDGQLPLVTARSLTRDDMDIEDVYAFFANKYFMCSSEMSDDERASLTTVRDSDDDNDYYYDIELTRSDSPRRALSLATNASFTCTGALRKSGFLCVKKWLLRKRHALELARRRGWKRYWVCLRGTCLLFYNCDPMGGVIDTIAKHVIFVDQSLVQSIPEHPRRDHVFCLSTAFGDAYLLDAACQSELGAWIASIHSACAASIARNSGRTGVVSVLRDECRRLERAVESGDKQRRELELTLSLTSESDALLERRRDLQALDDRVERARVDQYRLRCYVAALCGEEVPNPRTVLAHVSRRTKQTLSRLGVVAVSSLHALLCARQHVPQTASTAQQSTLQTHRSPQQSSSVVSGTSGSADTTHVTLSVHNNDSECRNIKTTNNSTIGDVISLALSTDHNTRPDIRDHFIRSSNDEGVTWTVQPVNECVGGANLNTHTLIQLLPKVLFSLEMTRASELQMFGFSVESEVDTRCTSDELRVFVSRVEHGSIAHERGLRAGDEVVVVNGACVADLDMLFVESVLTEERSLSLMIRSARLHAPHNACATPLDTASTATTRDACGGVDELIEALVCPPPPPSNDASSSERLLDDRLLSELIVPLPPDAHACTHSHSIQSEPAFSVNDELTTEELMSSTEPPLPIPIPPPLSHTLTLGGGRAAKVVRELLDTESSYVCSLEHLLQHYLQPLANSGLLSRADITVLFGALPSIIESQKEFLSALDTLAREHGLSSADVDADALSASVAELFVSHAPQLRDYSSFCASHSRAVKLLSDDRVGRWLNVRSGGQVALSLESFLIRPIQRVLKYPLLLTQIKACSTQLTSQTQQSIDDAIKHVERVCDHINEMQRIHDEYGAIFEHLARQHSRLQQTTPTNKTMTTMVTQSSLNLSPQSLLHYGGVEWTNSAEYLGKSARKGLELHSMCFVFRNCVIFLVKERIRHRKSRNTSSNVSSDVEIIRHQTLIPVSEVQVRACQQLENENDFKWDLIHVNILKTNRDSKRSEKVFRLSNSTNEYRNAFLRTIRQIIREDVRQMTVTPTTQSTTNTITTTSSSTNHSKPEIKPKPKQTSNQEHMEKQSSYDKEQLSSSGDTTVSGAAVMVSEVGGGVMSTSPQWKRRSCGENSTTTSTIMTTTATITTQSSHSSSTASSR